MYVAILADSHDNLPQLEKAVTWCNKHEIEHVLHAGDLIAPFVYRVMKKLEMPYTIVFGNNDGERTGLSNTFKGNIFPPPHSLQLDDKKIAMLHEPDSLEDLIKTGQYDLIVYGHTHAIDIQTEKNPLIINPGEIGGWLNGRSTMAVWNTQNNNVQIIDLNV
ncbi:MAG: metallophosphoesterase [candidate division KSB1 bacterium]|nr:metallophosphoesterase [candidate division KSB1 bacterium]